MAVCRGLGLGIAECPGSPSALRMFAPITPGAVYGGRFGRELRYNPDKPPHGVQRNLEETASGKF